MRTSFVLLCLALSAYSAGASVIGIDFGSTWMKVALVQLKVPLEIVPNFISKRKTEVAVAFDRGERMYGSDAAGLLSRKPNFAYSHFREMLGRFEGHPLADAVKEHKFGAQAYANLTRGGLNYRYKGDEAIGSFSSEELVAMVLTYARDITKEFGGIAVRDCVITVPSFSTQHERRALISAAEVAGLKVLSLIEDNTASALQYGKDNVFENKTVLYYNMGASATQVTIAQYSNYTVKEAGKNKTVGTFEVLAKAWDPTLGGEQLDLKLMNFFVDEFKRKQGVDVSDQAKAIGKLRAQATKTKHVLSANSDIPVKVNSVAEDKDLVVTLTRAQLETMAGDFIGRVTAPIVRALDFAGLTISDLDAVEMLGGAQRVPAIQSELASYFGEAMPLGVHLNADEAPALGAAFAAANISTAFKVRKTGMTDYSPFPVGVSLTSIATNPASSSEDDEKEGGMLGGLFGGGKKEVVPLTPEQEAAEAEAMAWSKSTTVFKSWSRLDSKKLIAFHHDHDIACGMFYAEPAEGEESLLPASTPKGLGGFNVTGVAAFAKELASKNVTSCGAEGNPKPKVTLHFKLDSSGIVRLSSASATCEQPLPVEEEEEASNNATDTTTNATEAAAAEGEKEKKEGEGDEADAKKEGDEATTEDKKEDDKKEDDAGDDDAKKSEEGEEELDEDAKAAKAAAAKKAKKEKKAAAKAEAAAKAKEAKEKAKKAKASVLKTELGVVEEFEVDKVEKMGGGPALSLQAASPFAVAEAKAKLAYLQAKDDERKLKLEAKNGLEAYLYSVKNKVEDELETMSQVSTDEQRESLTSLVAEVLEWLDDEGFDTKTEVYQTKKADVEDLAEPLFFRHDELTARPAAVAMARNRVRDIKLLVAKWVDSMPQVTEEERGDVIALCDKAEAWLDEKEAAQEEAKPHMAAKFTSTEVAAQLKGAANLVTRLSRKPKPKPPVVLLNATDVDANATDTGNATASAANETATDGADAGGGDDAGDKAESTEGGEGADGDDAKKEEEGAASKDENDEL